MGTLFSYQEYDTNSFPSTDAEWRDVINSQPTGNRAANSKNFRRDAFIHNTPAMKAHHASNEMSRALSTGCVPDYVWYFLVLEHVCIFVWVNVHAQECVKEQIPDGKDPFAPVSLNI